MMLSPILWMILSKPLQYFFNLITLLGLVHGTIAPVTECTAQAWVRAPDLTPNAVIHGDARVKISAGCPDIETVLLGLRLKERSFVKALRSPEDRKWMSSARQMPVDFRQASPWAFPPSTFANRSVEVAFQQTLADKDLWIVREEERVVFETMQVIPMVQGASQDHRDVEQSFSILVPSTNFPQALDHVNSAYMPGGVEMVNVESMYEYFIRASFANGATKDISAGFTGFDPLYALVDTPKKPTSDAIELKSVNPGPLKEDAAIVNYTVQITGDSGLVFTEGSDNQNVTVVITRTGPARTFNARLAVRARVQPTLSPKWATEYNVTASEPTNGPGYVLRSTLEDIEEAKRVGPTFPRIFDHSGKVHIKMPDSSPDEIASHKIVTTTSEAVTIPIKVDRRHISNFETYYQTLSNILAITLEAPSMVQKVDSDEPFTGLFAWDWDPVFEDDEKDVWRTYTGSVPVVVRPMPDTFKLVTRLQHCVGASTDMRGEVPLLGKAGCEQTSLNHYLDQGARAPIFVDPIAFVELITEDPAERELRAPILVPVVSSPPRGEELIFRYDPRLTADRHRPPIYVGETWARWVASRRKN